MHDGSLKTLQDVVDFYSDGGHRNPSQDPRMRPLHLADAEKRQLVAFLNALTGSVSDGLGGER
jgi:cytochrome c peroxidase